MSDKSYRAGKVVIAVVALIIAYLFALNGRYVTAHNGAVVLDKWKNEVTALGEYNWNVQETGVKEDKIKALYDQLKDGFELDDYETFRQQLKKEENQRSLYNAMEKEGYEMDGDFWSWQRRLREALGMESAL